MEETLERTQFQDSRKQHSLGVIKVDVGVFLNLIFRRPQLDLAALVSPSNQKCCTWDRLDSSATLANE